MDSMKKKCLGLIALLLAALLALSGCSQLETVLEQLPEPTEALTLVTAAPEANPTEVPPEAPTEKAAKKPTKTPTEAPTEKPTKKPTKAPTEKPTKKPTKAPTEKPTKAPAEAPTEKAGPITDPQDIADYLFEHGELPDNFLTKSEAQALGWDSSRNYLSDVAPGMSIGGDRYGNYEGTLPKAKGRKFFECDANYKGGKRGAERIVYSNDGHVWYTNDHYETFTELFPSN